MRLVYFAQVRELIGQSAEEVPVPPEVGSMAELVVWLKTRGAGYERAMTLQGLGYAIDQEFATETDSIDTAREIAFFPPISGG